MRLRSLNARRQSSRLNARQRPVQVEMLEARLVLDSTVVFNEIMYNPAGTVDEQMEFIELHNQLAVDMDISEWRLAGGVDFTFADGTIVPGRTQLVIAGDPEAFQAATGVGPGSG